MLPILQAAAVESWSAAIQTAFADATAVFLAAIPRIIGFLIIIIIGWFIASLIAKVVDKILDSVKFDDVATKSGFTGFVKKTGIESEASNFIALIVKWFIRLIVLVAAFDVLGLPAVSAVLEEFLLWIPNLLVALIVLVIAGLAANALSSLVRGATAQANLGNPDLLATISKVAVWVFGIVIAVNQIGIATELVNTLFMGFVGALALAVGLSFGLGGRETAAQIVQNWYQKGKEAAPKVGQAAQAAQQQAGSSGNPPPQGQSETVRPQQRRPPESSN